MFSQARISLIKFAINVIERYTFERQLSEYYRSISGDKIRTIIDVGVNKGQTIDFFLRLNPDCHIYGFEPNPSLFRYLTKKYGANKNIRLYNVGVSSKNGELIFNENVLNHTSTFEDLNESSEYLRKKARILGVAVGSIIKSRYPVKTIMLSDFIIDNISSDIDVIKIDTEGHEFACLQGLFNRRLPFQTRFLQLESHNDDMYANAHSSDEIAGLLRRHGFRLAKKVPHRIGDFDELVYEFADAR